MMTSRADGESIKLMKSMLEGTLALKGFPFGLVDVRDVAKAHVAAMETAEAGGKRFLVTSEEGVHKLKMAEMLRKDFSAYPIPTEGEEFPYVPKFSTARAKDILKWSPRPVEISLRDMAKAAIRNGIVDRKFNKKPAVFGKCGDIKPPEGKPSGLNLLVKVISLGEPEGKSREVKVGDNSGLVTLSLVDAESDGLAAGDIIEVRNATVRMVKGYIRLTVGKFGKVVKKEGDTSIVPDASKDVSAIEYELAIG